MALLLPARIDSPNLHIVGGLAPLGPNHTSAIVDDDYLTYASVDCKAIGPREHLEAKGGRRLHYDRGYEGIRPG